MEIVKSSFNSIDLENGKLIFDNHEVYVITDDDNITWFKGKDIAKTLEFSNTNDAINSNIPSRNKINFENIKGSTPATLHPHTIFINEAGLYNLLIRSKKAESKRI